MTLLCDCSADRTNPCLVCVVCNRVRVGTRGARASGDTAWNRAGQEKRMKRDFSDRLFRRLSASEGTNMIEAAIITPLLLIGSFAIVDFAVLLYVHLALANGVSLATRYGVPGNTMPGLSRENSMRAAMRDSTPTLTLDDAAFSFSHMGPGGGGWVAGTGGPNDVEKLRVDYTYHLMTPVLQPLFPYGEINFIVESAMKNEGLFTQ